MLFDFKCALRRLRKSPGYATVALLSLGLGIGANVAVFSALEAMLIRSLPVANPQELRVLAWRASSVPDSRFFEGMDYSRFGGSLPVITQLKSGQETADEFSYPAYLSLRDHADGFSSLFAFHDLGSATLAATGVAALAHGLEVSGNFFSGYSDRVLLGRTISAQDDRIEAPAVAVISFNLWQRCFGFDPHVLGRLVTINNTPFTVIGVLPEDYASPIAGKAVDFYAPFAALPFHPYQEFTVPTDSPYHWRVQVMGRLSARVKEGEVRAASSVVFAQSLKAAHLKLGRPVITLERGRRGSVSALDRVGVVRPVIVLMGTAACVLLVACANLGGLLLARGAQRRHEIAIRAALGARRFRLIRESFAESLLLALLGGCLGIVIASWSRPVLWNFITQYTDGLYFEPRTDLTVLGFALVISVIAAALFGLIPAISAPFTAPAGALKSGEAGAPRLRSARFLVVAQVALSLVLVFSAGLFVQSLVKLTGVSPGFNPANLLVFHVEPGQAGFRGAQLTAFSARVRGSISGIPGVLSVANSNELPLNHQANQFIAVFRSPQSARPVTVDSIFVSDTYFATMGIPILLGRGLDPTRNSGAVSRVVISKELAQMLFGDANPIGQKLPEYEGNDAMVVAGVCGDSGHYDRRDAHRPTIYLTYLFGNYYRLRSMYYEVRTALPPSSMVPAVRKAVAKVAPDVALGDMTTEQEIVSRSTAQSKMFATLCGTLASLAMGLSFIGLYGLLAFSVASRTREIGIRIALGAQSRDITRPILREAMSLAAIGIVFGAALALAIARLVQSSLFGVAASDPSTLAACAGALLLIAASAGWRPARRASLVDPVIALRAE